MIDSFPFDAWGDDVTTFWTFGPAGGAEGGSLTGTFVLTGLGMLLMVASLIYWVWLENKKLSAQAAHLRTAGGLGPAAGESQPTGRPQA
jgi:hypothetical protein